MTDQEAPKTDAAQDPAIAVKELMKANLDQALAEKVPERDRGKVKSSILEMLEEGKSAKEVLEIPSGQMELMYKHAYTLYQNRKYQESYETFGLLTRMDPDDYRFLFGYAASAHKLKLYDKAAGLYFLCTAKDPSDPMPWMHSADCALKMDNLFSACVMLDNAQQAAGDNPLHHKTKQQAIALREALVKHLEERDARS